MELDGKSIRFEGCEIVEGYFSAALKFEFIKKLEYMSKGISLGSEVLGYNFPDSYDVGDDGYFEKGIEFYINNQNIVISIEDFLSCLKVVCELYLTNNPEDKDAVLDYLTAIQANLE